MGDPTQCPRCGVWSPTHAPGDALCAGYQYAAVIAAQVRRREAAESALAASRAEAERLRAERDGLLKRLEAAIAPSERG